MTEDPGTTTLAERIERLFRTVRRPNGDPYSNEEVARACREGAGERFSTTYMWQLRTERRELWRRCRSVADELRLPGPFDAQRLVTELGARLGRPIELLPLPSRSCGPCGVLVSTDRAEYVGYPLDTTALHQQHIVLHELAHLLCRHRGQGAPSEAPAAAVPSGLLPHLSDELVRRVLGRHGYSELEEQEAELIASLARGPAAERRRLDVVPGITTAPDAPGSRRS